MKSGRTKLSERSESGCRLTSATGAVFIQAISRRCIRVTFTNGSAREDSHTGFIRENVAVPLKPTVTENDLAIEVSTPNLALRVDRQTGSFRWSDSEGTMLLDEGPAGGVELEQITVQRPVFDSGSASIETTKDGIKSVVQPTRWEPVRTALQARHALSFTDSEYVYGFGQAEEGLFNHRDTARELYQHNMSIAVPIMLSSRGYALFWDTASRASFHDDADGTYFWTDAVPQFEYYFIVGPDFREIVREIRALTGGASMWPVWAHGYWQSKEHYHTQSELEQVVGEFERRGVPMDVIVQDWHYWPEGQWGQKSFDSTRYPRPDEMAEAVHRRGKKLMISVWPNMSGECPDQIEMRNAGGLLADQTTYNAFDHDSRNVYAEQLERTLLKAGVDAFWTDCTEPYKGDWGGTVRLPKPVRDERNCREFELYIDQSRMSSYSLFHSQSISAAVSRSNPNARVVTLTRSHSPGQDRFGTVAWSGDISATWQTFRRQIASGLSFTMTGSPRWTCDIAGFCIRNDPAHWFWQGEFDDGPADPAFREFYTRWFQYATFLPVMRAHGTDYPREPWAFDVDGDKHYRILLDFIELRYQLIPYIYSVSAQEVLDGETLMRALVFDFRHDERARSVDDQFLFGPAFMVCPVTRPTEWAPGRGKLTDAHPTKRVYLPAGCTWIDFWTNERYGGGQWIEASVSVERLPVFVRSGSVVPLSSSGETAAVRLQSDSWTLRVYCGASGTFALYEDEGDGDAFQTGTSRWTDVSWNEREALLVIAPRPGSSSTSQKRRYLRIVFLRDGEESVREVQYNGAEIRVTPQDGNHGA